jgi:hypothetical protein
MLPSPERDGGARHERVWLAPLEPLERCLDKQREESSLSQRLEPALEDGHAHAQVEEDPMAPFADAEGLRTHQAGLPRQRDQACPRERLPVLRVGVGQRLVATGSPGLGEEDEVSGVRRLQAERQVRDWISGTLSASRVACACSTGRTACKRQYYAGTRRIRVSGVIVAITHTFDFAHPFEW